MSLIRTISILTIFALPLLCSGSAVGRRRRDVECESTGPLCKTSCVGIPSVMAYQWCGSCHKAIYCFDQNNFEVIECPPNNVWDDCQKRCILAESSPTCVECYEGGDIVSECTSTTPSPTPPPPICRFTGNSCISNCGGRPDGFYQWCGRCDFYIACVASLITIQPCPINSPWDDCNKRCDVFSNTCVECDNDNLLDVDCAETPTTTALPTASTTQGVECESTGETCTRICSDRVNGDYQYCGNCRQYLQCSDAGTFIQPCPGGLIWDDTIKGCDRLSTTCTECYIHTSTPARRMLN